MLAGLMVLALYGGFIDRLEASLNVTRGEEGSQITAMCFGEYVISCTMCRRCFFRTKKNVTGECGGQAV